MNYYEHHIGDYEKATAHLTACEDGIYGRLMRRYYDIEAPLPDDVKALQRFVRARTREERDAVQTILGEFFNLQADGWHHKRCDEEIARFVEKREKAKRSANARWSQSERNANASMSAHTEAMRTHCEGNALQTPDTRHQKEEEREKPNAPASPPLTPSSSKSDKPKRESGQTLAAWLDSLPPDEMAIPADDPVYAYAERVGLPEDFLTLQWAWFKSKYLAETKTRQKDWRLKFRNAVEGGWGNHWRIDQGGAYYLTTQGRQLERSLAEVQA